MKFYLFYFPIDFHPRFLQRDVCALHIQTCHANCLLVLLNDLPFHNFIASMCKTPYRSYPTTQVLHKFSFFRQEKNTWLHLENQTIPQTPTSLRTLSLWNTWQNMSCVRISETNGYDFFYSIIMPAAHESIILIFLNE